MRKSVMFLILVLLLASTASAGGVFSSLFGKVLNGSGDLETVKIDVGSFSKVKSSGPFDIYVKVGPSQSVELTIDDNLVDLVEFEVRGKTLKISTEGSFRTRKDVRIDITVPEITSLSLTGSGDIVVSGLKGEFFEFSLAGSGDMTAEGEVEVLEVSLSGSGDIDTRDLMANEVEVELSGSGDIKVYARESFDGSVSGSGDIAFYGDPEQVDRRVSGSGSIKRR